MFENQTMPAGFREVLPDPDGTEKRRFAQRLRLDEPLFEAIFRVGEQDYTVEVLDLSVLGFLVDFRADPPPVRMGTEAVLSIDILGREFQLKSVVRRIESSRVAFWFPEILSGDSQDGTSLQDVILELSSSD